MFSKAMLTILNEQIEKEGYSSNLYLAMASWAEANGLAGVAQWLYAQAEEERLHMLKFIAFINERGGHAIVPEFKKPPLTYKGLKELFAEVLKHEQFITASIHKILSLSVKENEFNTQNWIQWFVTEQMEEEKSVQEILDRLKIMGDHNLYMFDRDIMGMRGPAQPAV